MGQIVYDLTEAFVASTGKFPYYGIVRVAEEIACELYRIDPEVRFAIFSHAHDEFFEIHPKLDEKTGRVDLQIPQGVRISHHLRRKFYTENKLRDLLTPAAHALIRVVNRFRWNQAGLSLNSLDMNGKTLVSTGRPKHMVAALDALDRAGATYEFIPLLHDMFPLHEFPLKNRTAFSLNFIGDNGYVIEHASRIIAISEFTKSDIQSFSREGTLPPLPEIITVPLVQQCREGQEPPTQSIPDAPYILTVGTTLGRKNLEVVFEAMLLLEGRGKFVPHFVLAGALRKRVHHHMKMARFDRIRPYLHVVSDPHQADLVRLYRSAMALVLPSRLEGWGLPAGEALWCGTPSICSTAPVLYEVCGDLGLYFDPNQPDELAAIITRLHEDEAFAEDVRNRIEAAAPRLRTWSDVARDVKRVYEGS
jgi:glycosyltransferase involved in cell wall biosynthesis